MLHGKRILLIVGGGIAAYKSLLVIRQLRTQGARVRVILTRAGAEFVTPLSLASLAEEKVFTDLFSLTDETEMGHIELSREADLLVVAPATADLMAKMATGQADDLASTTLLATDKRVLVAPAMNVRMWTHPATRRNMAMLERDGVLVVGPNEGAMACGEFGPGRMAEPEEIVAAIAGHLSGRRARPLEGVRVLVTAGPTHEPIDPVRYLANRSSGRQGYAVAAAAQALGADTVLVTGPTALAPPDGVETVKVETADEMLAACEAALPADIGIFAAAVADWRVKSRSEEKLKKTAKEATTAFELAENPDILRTIASRKTGRPRLVIGFAAETENVVANATAKLETKGCDWIVANDVSPETGVMGGQENTVHLVTAEGAESWPKLGKDEVARRLVDRIADTLAETGGRAAK
ncbi:bifunctional phosphopantothenoylcysteine decarboxylase/phosphopantothenate--cysteine ligase CoaBC [Kaustia mangrovi]|uniref:Coenzyme A biosynthesis bifunctional protein CoaBC n=1 Tax=Kaustia mangrovi TaxID=2593653 RepID=A0A7S8HC91_9HYPH|nr:bifunctional phosphopantothenoylcysteine decarboxylase/phosphopantothenate--cysteine ligase CoaBC [Kaustia mangrovi]QPC43381.1 bifunctional phosphopantothenoylcysteine decarboxylase/phosphopantothenate--cysteine ligase CoaBC [Kaustia mangrovi]